jgi:O-acetyl-ADP-ribose deacetylase (regulator of RNase III)
MEAAMKKDMRSRFQVQQGDITQMKVDAIVNAANTSLLGGGGVDGAIHRAAGPQLLAECRSLGGCPTGEARITAGYRLPAKHVIHTVGPVYSGRPQDARLLAACYRNSLQLAVDNRVRTIAFPAISCGIYGYPIEEACTIAIRTCHEFLGEHDAPDLIVFVLFSEPHRRIYEETLAHLG